MQDKFGKSLAPLIDKKLFLFDMDGTICEEDRLFRGALELILEIDKTKKKYVFITNNSSKDVSSYLKKVHCLGIEAEEGNFYTSVDASIAYLKERYPEELVYCLGTKAMIKSLRTSGIRVTEQVQSDIGVALIGYDTELDYAKLRIASEVISLGIPYFGTNCDLACPSSFGFVPDCGAIALMLECSTGRKPKFLGKPESTMITPIVTASGLEKTEVIVIGDRLYTDIAIGFNNEIDTVCVLSGEASIEEISSSQIKPTYTLDGVEDIFKALIEIST